MSTALLVLFGIGAVVAGTPSELSSSAAVRRPLAPEGTRAKVIST